MPSRHATRAECASARATLEQVAHRQGPRDPYRRALPVREGLGPTVAHKGAGSLRGRLRDVPWYSLSTRLPALRASGGRRSASRAVEEHCAHGAGGGFVRTRLPSRRGVEIRAA